MNTLAQRSKDYYRIEKAIRFLGENFQDQPGLRETAAELGMSGPYFQRIFRRWAGISPKRFLQFLTKEYAKGLLKNSSLMEASYDAGLSGAGRLHDLFIHCEAVTPGEYKQKGAGLDIVYGFHPTPFGQCFIALTGRGICSLRFIDKTERKKVLQDFRKDWKNAKLGRDQGTTGKHIQRIFAASRNKKDPVAVLCRGTNFQIKVWEALLRIPPGNVVSYRAIARSIRRPRSVRAVANAVGRNPVAYLIPCHRVIRSTGQLGGYRWGLSRKRAILGAEAGARDAHEIG